MKLTECPLRTEGAWAEGNFSGNLFVAQSVPSQSGANNLVVVVVVVVVVVLAGELHLAAT